MTAYYTCFINDLPGAIPTSGSIVMANATGATWRVRGNTLLSHDRVQLLLEAIDPHLAPFGVEVVELPNVDRRDINKP